MATGAAAPKVAIAASGLGHIARGIEAWAQDVAGALRRRAIPVELFGGAPGPGITAVPCLRRTSPATRRILGVTRRLSGWRYGMGSDYEIEQTSFAINLWRAVRRDFDILHVQDPNVAMMLDRLNRAGLSRPRVILAHGTGEQADRLAGLSVVQELTPQALDKWHERGSAGPRLFCLPNFVDTSTFAPVDRMAARERLGLPKDAFIVLSCAAIRRFHKRVDYLLQEFATFSRAYGGNSLLVVAGGRESDTDELVAWGKELLGDRVRFIVAGPRANMPTLYQAADVFALASLFEMGSVAVIEALASGLPLICNDVPIFHFQGGPSNRYVAMSEAGALADALHAMSSMPRRAELERASRAYAEATFSEAAVIDRILDMYREVLSSPR